MDAIVALIDIVGGLELYSGQYAGLPAATGEIYLGVHGAHNLNGRISKLHVGSRCRIVICYLPARPVIHIHINLKYGPESAVLEVEVAGVAMVVI